MNFYKNVFSFFRDGNSHLNYHLIQPCSEGGQPVVSIGSNGELHTAGFNGHAAVMVTAHEFELRLNQSVIVHVEVHI